MNNYEHISHTHCWNQKPPSACGIPPEKHTQCCLCDLPWPQEKPTHEIGEMEAHFAEIAMRVDTSHTDWPWIRAAIYNLLTHQQERFIEVLEGMKKEYVEIGEFVPQPNPHQGKKTLTFKEVGEHARHELSESKRRLQHSMAQDGEQHSRHEKEIWNEAITDAIEAIKNAS